MIICSICLEDFESKREQGVSIKCGHVFHENCIQRWYLENLTPMGHYLNIPELPDVLDCPVCNVKHADPEFRKIFFTENADVGPKINKDEARIRELEEQCNQLRAQNSKILRGFRNAMPQLMLKCRVEIGKRIDLNNLPKTIGSQPELSIVQEGMNENSEKGKLSRRRVSKSVRERSDSAKYNYEADSEVNELNKSFYTFPPLKRKRV